MSNIFAKIFGICATPLPLDGDCWEYWDGDLKIELSHASELSSAGGALRFDGKGLPYGVLAFHGIDGEYHAFRNRCTHFGRKVDPVRGRREIKCCSLGGSTWNYQGKLISGLAKEDLKVLNLKKYAGELIIKVD